MSFNANTIHGFVFNGMNFLDQLDSKGLKAGWIDDQVNMADIDTALKYLNKYDNGRHLSAYERKRTENLIHTAIYGSNDYFAINKGIQYEYNGYQYKAKILKPNHVAKLNTKSARNYLKLMQEQLAEGRHGKNLDQDEFKKYLIFKWKQSGL